MHFRFSRTMLISILLLLFNTVKAEHVVHLNHACWKTKKHIHHRHSKHLTKIETIYRPLYCCKNRRNKKFIPAVIAVSAIYGSIATWSYFAWYDKQDHGSFAFNNEGWFGHDTYAGGADKLGHAYANYVMARGTAELLMWGGVSPCSATVIANTLTFGFFTGIEIKDGFHRTYGFSWEDMVSNVVGNVLAAIFITCPRIDEMFDYRLEYWPSPEYVRRVKNGDPNIGEDYSGMHYALWYHFSSIPCVKNACHSPLSILKYVDIGIGYHTDGYMPKPAGTTTVTQQLYFGITANIQQILDDLFFDGGRNNRIERQISRCINEVITLPGSALHLGPTKESPYPVEFLRN